VTENTALATLNKATLALARAEKIEDVSAIRSHAKVFQAHVKEFRLGREALLEGARVQLLAELKLGDIANKAAKAEGFGKMLADGAENLLRLPTQLTLTTMPIRH
jgi:hypothetical protein